MSKKTIHQMTRAKDFDKYLSREADSVRQNGSHRTYKFDGKGSVVVPMHNGDIPVGTRRSIVKMIIAIGLGLFVVVPVLLKVALCLNQYFS